MSAGATSGVAIREVKVGLLGCGGVGQAVVQTAAQASDSLTGAGMHLTFGMALVRDPDRPRIISGVPLTSDPALFSQYAPDVVVEVIGGIEPARSFVAEALSAGIPVVTANKSLVAAHGPALQALAARHGTSLYFEASVLAGVPCVNTLARRPLASSSGAWAGIVNGTSHFILSAMERGQSFDDALVGAVALGYAEPSSEADISGRDAAEKLTILLHLAGHTGVTPQDLPTRGIDGLEPWHFLLARRLGGVIKPIVLADCGAVSGAWVGPAFVAREHPFARVNGVTNILTIGRGPAAVTFSGPGAGPAVTAVSVLDDVVEAVSGPAPRLGASDPRGPARSDGIVGRGFSRADPGSVASRLKTPRAGSWFVVLEQVTSSAGELAEYLAANHLPALRLVVEGHRAAIVTAPASCATLQAAVEAIGATGAHLDWWPVLEAGHE